LYDALHGRLTEHHRFMLELYLGQHDALSKAIAKIDDAVDAAIAQMDKEVPGGQATFRSLILISTIFALRLGIMAEYSPPKWAAMPSVRLVLLADSDCTPLTSATYSDGSRRT
jgi:hypothetical protein